MLTDGRRYGVKWGLADSGSAAARTLDGVGKTARGAVGTGKVAGNDFDGIYPWRDIRRCNIQPVPGEQTHITYEGEDGFSLTGEKGDVFVEIPRFCSERRIEGGCEHRVIEGSGQHVHPAFVENGRVLDRIYVSAYEGGLDDDGVLRSIAGIRPLESKTAQSCLDLARGRGPGHSLLDWRTLDAIQNLMYVEHANRNSASLIGYGWSDLHQPVGTALRSLLAEPATNRIVVDGAEVTTARLERLFPGSNVLIIRGRDQHVLYRRKLASVAPETPAGGQCTFVFDGDPAAIDPTMNLGSGPQDTGLADVMAYHTGRTDRPKVVSTSTNERRRLNSNRYRYMENLTGNVWHFLPDVGFRDRVPYVCRSMKDCRFFTYGGAYEPVSGALPLQGENTDGHWVTSLLMDGRNAWFAYPDGFSSQADTDSHWGGFYYLNDGDMAIAHGGGFDHHIRCNLMTYRAWITAARSWYLYGGRLIYKSVV